MRYAVKGKPDFHNVNDEKLKSFQDLTQQLIFAYDYHDKDIAKVLKQVYKDLNIESAERLAESAMKSIEEEDSEVPVMTLKKPKKLCRSPVKRKI